MRILETRNITTQEDTVLTTHAGMGYQMVMRGGVSLGDDSESTQARAARFMLEAQPNGKSVAWIGGGMCVGPKLFTMCSCQQTVFEIEPSLKEFCPSGVTFVEGAYPESFFGKYDVIIYDIGGDVPRDVLAANLNPGGIILSLTE